MSPTRAPSETASAAASPPAVGRWHGWAWLAVVAPLGAALDQVTKRVADDALTGRGIVTVVDGYFDLRLSRNAGAFFSLGASLPDGVRRGFFVVATLAVLGFMVRLYFKTEPAHRTLRTALVLLCAGAVGNLVDRVLYGEVIDFLHLHLEEVFHWATFNVADIYITVGLALMVLDMFGVGRPPSVKAARG